MLTYKELNLNKNVIINNKREELFIEIKKKMKELHLGVGGVKDNEGYSCVLMLNQPAKLLTDIEASSSTISLYKDKKDGSLTRYWIENNKICSESLKAAEWEDISSELPKSGKMEADTILAQKISLKYGCSPDKKREAIRDLVSADHKVVSLQDSSGKTLLHHAVIWGLCKITQLLLSQGAPINAQDYKGKTVLHYAAEGTDAILLALSKESKIDLDLPDRIGNTALHISIKAGKPACAKILVSAGAEKEIKNYDQLTPAGLIKEWEDKILLPSKVLMLKNESEKEALGSNAIGLLKKKGSPKKGNSKTSEDELIAYWQTPEGIIKAKSIRMCDLGEDILTLLPNIGSKQINTELTEKIISKYVCSLALELKNALQETNLTNALSEENGKEVFNYLQDFEQSLGEYKKEPIGLGSSPKKPRRQRELSKVERSKSNHFSLITRQQVRPQAPLIKGNLNVFYYNAIRNYEGPFEDAYSTKNVAGLVEEIKKEAQTNPSELKKKLNQFIENPKEFEDIALMSLDVSKELSVMGSDLHLMSSFPVENLGSYKNSYIFAEKVLKYITVAGQYENKNVNIENIETFLKGISEINSTKANKLYLSADQVNKLITLNGGHYPAIKKDILREAELLNRPILILKGCNRILMVGKFDKNNEQNDKLTIYICRDSEHKGDLLAYWFDNEGNQFLPHRISDEDKQVILELKEELESEGISPNDRPFSKILEKCGYKNTFFIYRDENGDENWNFVEITHLAEKIYSHPLPFDKKVRVKEISRDETYSDLRYIFQKVHTPTNKLAKVLLFLAFLELQPQLDAEKNEFDKRTSDFEADFRQKLLKAGLKKFCTAQEINYLMPEDLLTILKMHRSVSILTKESDREKLAADEIGLLDVKGSPHVEDELVAYWKTSEGIKDQSIRMREAGDILKLLPKCHILRLKEGDNLNGLQANQIGLLERDGKLTVCWLNDQNGYSGVLMLDKEPELSDIDGHVSNMIPLFIKNEKLIRYWIENKEIRSESLEQSKWNDISNKLPRPGDSSPEIELVWEITSKYGCTHKSKVLGESLEARKVSDLALPAPGKESTDPKVIKAIIALCSCIPPALKSSNPELIQKITFKYDIQKEKMAHLQLLTNICSGDSRYNTIYMLTKLSVLMLASEPVLADIAHLDGSVIPMYEDKENGILTRYWIEKNEICSGSRKVSEILNRNRLPIPGAKSTDINLIMEITTEYKYDRRWDDPRVLGKDQIGLLDQGDKIIVFWRDKNDGFKSECLDGSRLKDIRWQLPPEGQNSKNQGLIKTIQCGGYNRILMLDKEPEELSDIAKIRSSILPLYEKNGNLIMYWAEKNKICSKSLEQPKWNDISNKLPRPGKVLGDINVVWEITSKYRCTQCGYTPNSDVVINLKSVIQRCLGLMDFVEPDRIISLLQALNPLFSNMQNLQNLLLVSILTGLCLRFYRDLPNFDGQVESYISSYRDKHKEITSSLKEYLEHLRTFKEHSLYTIFEQIRPSLIPAVTQKYNLWNKINEVVQNSNRLKPNELQNVIIEMAKELANPSITFYSGVSLDELRLDCWELKKQSLALSEYSGSFDLMIALIRDIICSFRTREEQAQAIRFFMLVAEELSNYKYGHAITPETAIGYAMTSKEVEKLGVFELLDANTLQKKENLDKFIQGEYVKLQKSDLHALPHIPLLFKIKATGYEAGSHNSLLMLGEIFYRLWNLKIKFAKIPIDLKADLGQRSDLVQQLKLINLKLLQSKKAEEEALAKKISQQPAIPGKEGECVIVIKEDLPVQSQHSRPSRSRKQNSLPQKSSQVHLPKYSSSDAIIEKNAKNKDLRRENTAASSKKNYRSPSPVLKNNRLLPHSREESYVSKAGDKRGRTSPMYQSPRFFKRDDTLDGSTANVSTAPVSNDTVSNNGRLDTSTSTQSSKKAHESNLDLRVN